jgi:hypothetical protein
LLRSCFSLSSIPVADYQTRDRGSSPRPAVNLTD